MQHLIYRKENDTEATVNHWHKNDLFWSLPEHVCCDFYYSQWDSKAELTPLIIRTIETIIWCIFDDCYQ